ncbi:MAG: pyridoxamine 5'-phosphate oxidase family protein [Dehalococcoidia bacterium]
MDVASFAEIEEEFMRRVARTVWCTVATVDRQGRPRSRILHPIWEGSTGWIATGRQTLKTRHLAKNPYVSLSYWDPEHEQVYVDCKAAWDDDMAQKKRVWELYKATPPPLGYDPGIIWQGGPEDPGYGLLKLTPWRIELWSLRDMITGAEPKVWRAS